MGELDGRRRDRRGGEVAEEKGKIRNEVAIVIAAGLLCQWFEMRGNHF